MSEWISVEDRLPEAFTTVRLKWIDANGERQKGLGYREKHMQSGQWAMIQFPTETEFPLGITHWQPDPPGEE